MPDETTKSFNIGNLLLVEAGVTPEQLTCALEEQTHNPHKKVGEILVAMGALTPAQLDNALRKQANWRKRGPSQTDVNRMADFATQKTVDVTSDMDDLLDIVPTKFK